MASVKRMLKIGNDLRKLNHEVILPRFTEQYAQMDNLDKVLSESAKNKINYDLIRDYIIDMADFGVFLFGFL